MKKIICSKKFWSYNLDHQATGSVDWNSNLAISRATFITLFKQQDSWFARLIRLNKTLATVSDVPVVLSSGQC